MFPTIPLSFHLGMAFFILSQLGTTCAFWVRILACIGFERERFLFLGNTDFFLKMVSLCIAMLDISHLPVFVACLSFLNISSCHSLSSSLSLPSFANSLFLLCLTNHNLSLWPLDYALLRLPLDRQANPKNVCL